jgi:hypothetical protein
VGEHIDARLDFEGHAAIDAAIARKQREGVEAIWWIMGRHGHAFLADEVGMGKTYQALGVVALTWMRDPSARVLVITPNAAIQNNWRREYEHFVCDNVRACGGRVRDPLTGDPARPAALHANVGELMVAALTGRRALHVVRLSAFSNVATSLGLKPGEDDPTPTYASIAAKLRAARFHVDVPEGVEDVELGSSHAINVAAARMLGPILPAFDLVVIDESHLLRNRGGNIMTSTLGHILGMRPTTPADPGEPAPTPPATLFLSATPAHRAERDIFAQLAFVDPLGDRYDELSGPERLEVVESRFVRRLRHFEDRTKYAYRRDVLHSALAVRDPRDSHAPQARADEEPDVLDELFFIAAQRGVEEALHDARRDELNATIKLGFLECFESYEPTRLEPTGGEEDEGAPEGTHYGDDRGVARDHSAIHDLSEAYHRATGGELPPHPKMRQIERTYRRDVLEGPRPEKLLIFVRRLASVAEITRRVTTLYDAHALAWLSEVLSPEQGPFADARALEAWASGKLGRESIAEETEAEDEGAERTRSRVLEVFASRKGADASPSHRFRSRFLSSGPYREVFEENLLRVYQRACHPGEDFGAFTARLMLMPYPGGAMQTLRGRLLGELAAAEFWKSGKEEFKAPRAAALVHLRAFETLAGFETTHQALSKTLRDMTRASHDLIAPKHPADLAPHSARVIEDELDALVARESAWGAMARAWRGHAHEDLREVADALSVDPAPDGLRARLERRMFLRHVWEKNLRVGEGVLELFCAFVEARDATRGQDGLDRSEVADALARRIAQDATTGRRHTAWRMAEFSRLTPHMKKLLSGHAEKKRAWWSETKWSVFDGQDPIQGVVGGSSGRERAITQFNSPFFPDVIACTDVLREGVNLHLCCRRVWHFGLSTTPGDVEQRTGRVDRYHCVVHRALARERGEDTDEARRSLEVGYPYLSRSIDERQLAQALRQRLLIQPLLDRGTLDAATPSGTGDLSLDGELPSLERIRDDLTRMSANSEAPFFPEITRAPGAIADPLGGLPDVEAMRSRGAQRALRGILARVAGREGGEVAPDPEANLSDVAWFNVPVHVDGATRDQPIRATLGRSEGPCAHVLTLRTPLGDAVETHALQEHVQTHLALTDLRLEVTGEPGDFAHALASDVPLFDEDLVVLTHGDTHGVGPRLNAAVLRLARMADATERALTPTQDIPWKTL